MTVTQESDPNGGRLLGALFAAVQPFVEAADTSMMPVGIRIFQGDPATVELSYFDAAGTPRTFRAVGTGDVGSGLVLAAGPVLEGGLNRLPVTQRQKVNAAIQSGRVALALHLEPVFGHASIVLTAEGREDISLITLAGGDVH